MTVISCFSIYVSVNKTDCSYPGKGVCTRDPVSRRNEDPLFPWSLIVYSLLSL